MSARCASVDPEVWFDYEEYRRDSNIRKQKAAAAKAICGRCVLLVKCREYGLSTRQPSGIWGGLDVDDRENVYAGGRDATPTALLQVVESAADLERPEITTQHGEMQAA
jgi:WhiB family redox-sensing transcriptional regulator